MELNEKSIEGEGGEEEAVFVFHHQQINVFYKCTTLGTATTALTSTIVLRGETEHLLMNSKTFP